jgi:excisionase family DNA binding protein
LTALVDEPLLVTVSQARQLLRIGNTTIYKLIGCGDLDSLCVGRTRRITMQSIKRYIARQLAKSATHAR